MAEVDIRDTTGIILDDNLDTAGGGATERELNAGSTPNRTTWEVESSRIETVNLQEPHGLEAGAQIRLTTRGTEVSRVEFDGRLRASLYRINREFNTPGAERFNGRVDGRVYRKGDWQNKTLDDVVRYIVEQTEGVLLYDGSAPKEYAGPLVFRNVPAPQAITQALEVEGNNLWTVKPDGRTVTVVNRSPGGEPVGVVGLNVVEQSITGAEVETGRPAMVTDRDSRGMKTQYGGPAYFGRDTPRGDIFGAPAPLELEPDISDLVRAATEAGISLEQAYGLTFPAKRFGRIGWRVPRDAKGEVIRAELRLVQRGQMAGDLVTRNAEFVPRAYQADLLTHPNLKFAFEAKIAGEPSVLQEHTVSQAEEPALLGRLNAAIGRANGRVTDDVAGKPTGRNAVFQIVRSPAFPWRTKNGQVVPHVRVALLAFYEPQWIPIDGHVDLEAGEFVLDAGNQPNFSRVCSCLAFPAGFAVSVGYSFAAENGAMPDGLGNLAPVLAVIVDFAGGIRLTRFRAHVATVEEIPPVIAPAGGLPPFGAVESGDYEVHNVVLNAAGVPGNEAPEEKPRDDRPVMTTRAANLARSLTASSMARGQITIFPGDESLQIGQPANGGVIVKIRHRYTPFFQTTFWLEGSADVDHPEAKHWRKKIGEYEGYTQTNSAQIAAGARRSDSTASSSAGSTKVEPHDHSDDQSGGSRLGDVRAASVLIEGVNEDGTPRLLARRGSMTGPVDLKWVPGIGRLVSGGLLVEVDGVDEDTALVSGRIARAGSQAARVTGILPFIGGQIEKDPEVVRKYVSSGAIRPLFFVEDADPSTPPEPAIFIEEDTLVVDHLGEDGADDNRSTKVRAAVEEDGEPIVADLDDLFIVRETDGPTGSTPRLSLYMAEKENAPGDPRGGFIAGPHEGSTDRTDTRAGQLSDVLRYAKDQEAHPDRLTVRSDAVITDASFGHEGPLDFAPLHGDFDVYSVDGARGIPLVHDGRDWKGVAGEPRGLRWKALPICDHMHADSHGLPCGGSPCGENQSSQVFEGDLSDRGDLDDITTVWKKRWQLFMETTDRLAGTAPVDPCTGDRRTGFITNRRQEARLGEVFCYHDGNATGRTPLDIQAATHFKLTSVLGSPVLDGPLAFIGPPAEGKAKFHPPEEFLYGYHVLDRSAPAAGAPGTWFVEVPFDPCASPGLVAEFTRAFENEDFVNAVQLQNAQMLGDAMQKVWERFCTVTFPFLTGWLAQLHQAGAETRSLLAAVQERLLECLAHCCGATTGGTGTGGAGVGGTGGSTGGATGGRTEVCIPIEIPAHPTAPTSPGCSTPRDLEVLGPYVSAELKEPCKEEDGNEENSSDPPPPPWFGGIQ